MVRATGAVESGGSRDVVDGGVEREIYGKSGVGAVVEAQLGFCKNERPPLGDVSVTCLLKRYRTVRVERGVTE